MSRQIYNYRARAEHDRIRLVLCRPERDVPKGACYVGHCGKTWVWVPPDGYGTLTEFTLTVMRISSLIKETQTLLSPWLVLADHALRPDAVAHQPRSRRQMHLRGDDADDCQAAA